MYGLGGLIVSRLRLEKEMETAKLFRVEALGSGEFSNWVKDGDSWGYDYSMAYRGYNPGP